MNALFAGHSKLKLPLLRGILAGLRTQAHDAMSQDLGHLLVALVLGHLGGVEDVVGDFGHGEDGTCGRGRIFRLHPSS